MVALLAAGLTEDAKAETAVRVSQSCNSPRAVESFCRLVKVDYGALTRYTTSSESDLRRLQTARDSNGVIVRAVLAVNYAAPVKPQAPETFIPDTRSVEEKLRDAKASVRSGPLADSSIISLSNRPTLLQSRDSREGYGNIAAGPIKA